MTEWGAANNSNSATAKRGEVRRISCLRINRCKGVMGSKKLVVASMVAQVRRFVVEHTMA
jgi:hypothetical protein